MGTGVERISNREGMAAGQKQAWVRELAQPELEHLVQPRAGSEQKLVRGRRSFQQQRMLPPPERGLAQEERVAKQPRELVKAERTLRSAARRALVAEQEPALEPAVWPALAWKFASEQALREPQVLDALRPTAELHLLALVARLVVVRVCSPTQGLPQGRVSQQLSACVPIA